MLVLKRSVETEFPAIFYNDALTFEVALSCEPTVSPLNNNQIDFRISFDESDDEDYTKEFPAIAYNNALTSKLDFSPEPTVSLYGVSRIPEIGLHGFHISCTGPHWKEIDNVGDVGLTSGWRTVVRATGAKRMVLVIISDNDTHDDWKRVPKRWRVLLMVQVYERCIVCGGCESGCCAVQGKKGKDEQATEEEGGGEEERIMEAAQGSVV
ncbi:hypothetical protein Tco_0841910 [Tanacetum coccineum]|uniref:Uncharacterized protein n=1 Tax=Tanacetum coccineum TaxID=301880 RepID=A0ABQ5AZ17_9ASTR